MKDLNRFLSCSKNESFLEQERNRWIKEIKANVNKNPLEIFPRFLFFTVSRNDHNARFRGILDSSKGSKCGDSEPP